MYCHNLEKQQNEQNDLLNNINNFGVSQRDIEQQKKIEKIIKENNERRREIQSQQQNQRPWHQNQGQNQHISRRNQNHNQQNSRQNQLNHRQNIQNQQNQRQQRINININNNLIGNDDNILTDSDIQLFNQLGRHEINNGNVRPNSLNQNQHQQPHIRITRARTGPNGVTVFEQIGGNNQSNFQRMMINNNNMNIPNMNIMMGNNNRSNRMFIPISDINSINSLFAQLLSGARYHEHPTSQQILNSLPENQIDDVTKLDSEKKNCVICLEDFKNGDKATFLPCIHLFHTDCIKNWLKTQDCCPICKFKLTGQNLNLNH